jgi:hypothetical protein
LNTRAASCQLPYRQFTPANTPNTGSQYLLGRPTSCQSVPHHLHPRVSCPCWAQYSPGLEMSLRGIKSVPLLLRQTWPLLTDSVKVCRARAAIVWRGIGSSRKMACSGGIRVGAANWSTLKMARLGGEQGCCECGLLLPRQLCLWCLTCAFPSAALDPPPIFGYSRLRLQSFRPNTLLPSRSFLSSSLGRFGHGSFYTTIALSSLCINPPNNSAVKNTMHTSIRHNH